MRLRFFDHFGREAMGQVKLADHDLDVDSEIVFFAENFDDAAPRILRGAGPVGDFHVDDYAFEILPVGVDCGFVAYDSVERLLALWPCVPVVALDVDPARQPQGHGGTRIAGSPSPAE